MRHVVIVFMSFVFVTCNTFFSSHFASQGLELFLAILFFFVCFLFLCSFVLFHVLFYCSWWLY